MILLNLKDSERIEKLHPQLKKVFDFVKTHDLRNVPAGRIVLDDDKLFINVDDAKLIDKKEQKMEVHRKYMDIHFPLSDTELIGWRALSTIEVEPSTPYNEEKDFAFYEVPASTYFEVHPGEFFIAYPEDAHAPIIGEGTLRKIIAKVKL